MIAIEAMNPLMIGLSVSLGETDGNAAALAPRRKSASFSKLEPFSSGS
jgi:hypothetical protein